MKISDAKSYLTSIVKHNLDVMEHGRDVNDYVVPFFVGDPGVGKTAVPKQVAKEVGIPYFQTIVAQYDAGELAGLPFTDKDHREVETTAKDGSKVMTIEERTRMIRLRPDYLPDIENPEHLIGVYNLDELPQAFLANQNICSQIVNEWRVGHHMISRGITICCTGNKPENKAGTTSMPTHLRDRLNFISIDVDIDDSLRFFSEIGVDPRIRAYLRQNPGKLHKFDAGANSNPTPRSWEKLSSILKMGLPTHIRTDAIAGQIGAGVGTEFESWIRVEDRLPKIEDIIADPQGAPLFSNRDADLLYLLLTALADVAKKTNIGKILEYIKRMPNQEFAAYWAQDCFARDKSLLQEKVVTQWKMTDGAKLLF